MKKVYKFLVFMLTCSALKGMDYHQLKAEIAGNSPLNIIGQIGAGLAISYAGEFANTFFHELGHALTAKLLLDAPIAIALGTTKVEPTDGIHFYGFNSRVGRTDYPAILFPNRATERKLAAVCFAGPLVGLAQAIACDSILKQQQILPPLTTAICQISNNINFCRNIAQLIPTHIARDGAQAAHYLRLLKLQQNGTLLYPKPVMTALCSARDLLSIYPILSPAFGYLIQWWKEHKN